MIINIMMRLCIKTKSIITKNDRQGSGGDKNLQNIYYLDETNIKQGGGGQFSSIHRRAAQAGSTLAQVVSKNISPKYITKYITQIIVQIWLKLYSWTWNILQMRNNFFENEDDSPLLVTSIDGISTQVLHYLHNHQYCD